ncbi:MAG: CvpA family protein [Chloroflexi bacterium]|nr:CvpA family protein [Chloroflexota bacterium]
MADLVLLFLIGGLVLAGWRSGFLRRLVGLAFLGVSFLASTYLRAPAGAIVHGVLPKIPEPYAEMVGYVVAFPVILFALNLFATPLLARAPQHGLSEVADKSLGAVLGFAEGVLIASAAIVILHTFSTIGSGLPSTFVETGVLKDIRTQVDDSTIGGLLEQTTVPIVLLLLGPLLPKDIKDVVPTTIPGGIPFFPGGLQKP